MATIDSEDIEIVTEALYIAVRGSLDDWHADSGRIQDSYRNNARAILARLADRLLPRDADMQERRYHRTAGTGVEYPCATVDCIVPVTRTAYTALWSVDRG